MLSCVNFHTKRILQSHFCHTETDPDPNAGENWTPLLSLFNHQLPPPAFSPHHFLHSFLSSRSSPPSHLPSVLSLNPISNFLYIFHSFLFFYPLSKPQPANKNLTLLDLTWSRIWDNWAEPSFRNHLHFGCRALHFSGPTPVPPMSGDKTIPAGFKLKLKGQQKQSFIEPIYLHI